MATSRASTNQRQRTWRPQAPRPEQTAWRRRLFRILLPAVGLGLLGLLTWLLILPLLRPAELKLIAIAVADYGNPEAPPIPYCYEDLKALREAISTGASEESKAWNDATSDNIAQLRDSLSQAAKPRDNLLVYIKAHGVSLNGAAYVLDGDFELRNGRGRLPIKELLKDVAASPAKVKLLVLDTGHLESDPRMGMLTNQFTRLVEQAVASLPATDDIWVLTSNSLFERARFSMGDRRSSFGYYVAQGLQGAADGIVDEQPADDKIQLNELYQYVRQNVSHYAQVISSDSQTPLLLRAGQGEVQEIPNDIFLLRKSPLSSIDGDGEVALTSPDRPPRGRGDHLPLTMGVALALQDAGAAPPATSPENREASSASNTGGADQEKAKTDDAASKEGSLPAAPADQSKKTASDDKGNAPAKAEPSKKAEETKDERTKAAVPPSPPPRKRARLEQTLLDFDAWLMNEQQGQGWRPVDYAPDLARLYYENLMGCRERAFAGRLFHEQPDYVASLGRKLSELSDIQRRIKARGDQFAAGLARPTYEFDPAVRDAIRLRNEACFLLPLLSAHYSLAGGSAQSALQSELRGMSEATLGLARLLSSSAAETPQAFEQWKSSLRASEKDARDRLVKLREDFQARCQKQKGAVDADNRHALAHSLAELSQNPLAAPVQREELHDLAAKVAVRFADVERVKLPPTSNPSAFAELGWQRVLDRAQLELDMLELVLGDERDTRVLDIRQKVASATTLADDESRLGLAQRIDELLNGAYRNLPDRITTQLQSRAYAAYRSAETAIRLADARDQERVEKVLGERMGPDPVIGVPLVLPKFEKLYHLTLAGSSSANAVDVSLKYGALDKLPVRFEANAPLPSRLRLKIDYDDRRVRLRALGNELRAGSILEISSGSEGGVSSSEFTTQLEIASLDERGDQTRLELSWLDDETKLASASAALIHPSPSRLQIAVYGQRGMAGHSWRDDPQGNAYFELPSPDGVAHARLLTFAGHENRFDFRLTNAASYGKKYTAVVYSIPLNEPIAEGKNRGLSLAAAAERSARELARNELSFEARQTLSLPFYPPAPKPAPDKPDAAKPTDTTEGEPAKDPPPEVTRGLVCVLTEGSQTPSPDSTKPRVQRIVIEFKTLPPDRYIRPRISYDAGEGKIEARLNTEPGRLPATGSRVELEVVSRESGAQPAAARLKTTLTRDNTEGQLRSYVKPGTPGAAQVYLHVDGYPRAFTYEVALDASRSDVERKLDLHEVALRKNFRIHYPKTLSEPLVFPFAVDMPPSSDRDYLVRLFIDSQPGNDSFIPLEDKLVFESFEDRTHRNFLVKPKSAGGMLVQTQVTDFVSMLDLSAYENQPVHVRVQLVEVESEGAERVLGPVDNPADKSIVLYLDGTAPTLAVRVPNKAFYENDKVRIDLTPDDKGSGVKQVLYATKLQKNPDSKAANEYVLADPKPVPRVGNGVFQLSQTFEKAGDQSIWFQVTDNSGNESEMKEVVIEVQKRSVASDKAVPTPAEQLGKIAGRATLPDGAGGQIAKVVLSRGGKVIKEIPKPPNGRFVFDKLPPGDYEVKAEGTISGNFGKPIPVPVTVKPEETVDPGVVTLGR